MRIVPLLFLFGACAASASTNRAHDRFERELAGRVAGEPRACIPAERGQNLVIEDKSTISSRRGDTLWVNRLGHACPGFEPLATLVIDVHGSQHCRGDRVQALSYASSIPGPFCVLGDFTPYRRPR